MKNVTLFLLYMVNTIIRFISIKKLNIYIAPNKSISIGLQWLFLNTQTPKNLYIRVFISKKIWPQAIGRLFKYDLTIAIASLFFFFPFFFSHFPLSLLLVPTFWLFFHFSPYILILPLLVPKPINACYFCPFRQSTDGNS